jgi:tryptophan halogenase
MSTNFKPLKIAVIGGGTAGCMTAAHITKYFPNFDLYHIYDSRIPTIGVGEGTQANFPQWLESITGLKFDELQSRCNITRKFAIQFENWGTKNKQFIHNFYPIKEAYGYHISADKLAELLKDHISATHIDQKIIALKSDGVAVNITFEDNTELEFDLVFDASGFPKSLDNNEYTNISLIPTNAALIRRGAAVDFNSATRSVARPYGWIFIIPLTSHTSYGYIYNTSINSRDEIEWDLSQFLQEENVTPYGESKHLKFPNFSCRTFFDGSLFKIGNCASFIEPLEATAIGIFHAQIAYASEYLKYLAKSNSPKQKIDESTINAFNELLFQIVYKAALFVGWHYAKGSCFNTDFWHFAKSNFEQEIDKLANTKLLRKFESYIQAGSEVNYFLSFGKLNSFIKPFGGFRPASFYEIGTGIGYYSSTNKNKKLARQQ